ncbi:MAG: hydrogenase [archaeon]|nr:hydrogenase [archaeon]
MKLYNMIFDLLKSKLPLSNDLMTANIGAELLLIISLILVCLLFRHINVLLSAILIIFVLVFTITNMPLIPKFKSEQDDSLNKMMFYVLIALGIIITFLYWGGRFV